MTTMNPECWFNVLRKDDGQWYWDFYDRHNVRWAVSSQVFDSKTEALKSIAKFREMTRDAAINTMLYD